LEATDGSRAGENTAETVSRAQTVQIIEAEIAQLSVRQREAFLLRYWEEFDVTETASAMGCSEGSVKVHCSRAVSALAKALKAKGVTP
jgi:RNA polymerase sigma-70 factor (ECF subfamily)